MVRTVILRGELYTAQLDPVVGSEQGGRRPVLVVQNDQGNRFSPTVIVLALTSQLQKARLPTHVTIRAGETGLSRDSVAMAEQLRIASIIKYATMIVATLPVIAAYPFIQRYFVKGVMIGSIKG